MKKNLKNTTKIIVSVVEKVITALVLVTSLKLVFEGAIAQNELMESIGFAMCCMVELISIVRKKEITSVTALTIISIEFSLAQMRPLF